MMTATSKEEDGSSKIAPLTPGMKEILHQSILHYLHHSGFSKTFKRFQSEAQIQNDMWKTSSANLEDVYCKYINACHHTELDIGGTKKDGKDVCIVHEKTTKSKKKKKSSVECDKGATEDQSGATMGHGEISEDNVVVESETKAKKKKKSKHDLASCGETEEPKSAAPKKPVDDSMNELEANESTKKPKDKKRKSNQPEVVAENGDVAKEDKKSSKKRKRLLSDENEDQSAKMETNKTIDESKRQKTEASKEDQVDESLAHGTSDHKQINELGNEKPETNGGEKYGSQKSVKKQRNGSAEPKTINAFQRVKIDQVEFAHEKLQDNSYWAKDGADVGYGAKAQEVLGQVRGRDFRHEKTKKKRGSYRGGQIDLHSHSIKFNYSDEE